MNKLINRTLYINKILKWTNSDLVKILVGVRRCGKSSLLNLLQKHFTENGIKKEQIISISFERKEYKHLKDSDKLHDYIERNLYKDGKTYIFIDEIQEVNEWSYIINSINVSFDVDIYVTGSNANLFSGSYLTYLAGRYISFEIFPLSIKEIRTFKNEENNLEDYYLTSQSGTFPMILLENDSEIKKGNMESLYQSIYLRDIMLAGKIKNTYQVENMARYIFENIGKEISIRKMHNFMKSNNEEMSITTMSTYLKLFESAFLIYHCKRYDSIGKKLLTTNGKFYSVDLAIAKNVSSNISINDGFLFENFVYLELRKAGFKVQTLMVNRDYEIDFYATKNNRKLFIQVCISIMNDETRERESRPFKYIKEYGEKLLLTKDKTIFSFSTCKHQNIFDFIENEL